MHQLNFLIRRIETKKIVQSNQGITILPELASRDMTIEQKMFVFFETPLLFVKFGLVTDRHFLKEG